MHEKFRIYNLLYVVHADVESMAASEEPDSSVFSRSGSSIGCRHSVCITAPCRWCQERWDVSEFVGRGSDTAQRWTEDNPYWTVGNVCQTDYKPGE